METMELTILILSIAALTISAFVLGYRIGTRK